ncbi:SusD/RagB family nutrient-binding outer membrane lipoprotein [Mucilaginibacter arboris]|uniref:SusD/RagB family nutrient-binding outer membrane lipoprotein n=1 Tax=Mucilaginibacter arboris TaxID=2682090 RepID=A0A7K1ST53_9SPHI|nr:SusD/RagB family nutrient-binding outer membrane lipoprotein [Mucilaginibacter arboris]MVN20493.1 SusD/RagB family nutrient-binding outer membrane lipoprotein [Mucilaginibacter arboris]
MKKIYILGLLAFALLNHSCKKDLININTNPNKLSDVSPEILFTGATADFGLTSRANTSKKYGTTMTYMQYIVSDGADATGLASAYWNPTKTTGPNPGFPYYNDYYTGMGRDMHRIIDKINSLPTEQQGSYQGLKAISSVIDTYLAWRVSDIFGAMPYLQAFNDVQYPLPAYDYDYTLYKVYDKQLKDAATLLKNNTSGQIALGNQDFFFGGDYTKWLAFANTLRIKIAQRYEKRDATNLTSVLNDIATNFASNIISSNAGSFGYDQTRNWNNNVDDINVILFSYDAAFPFVEFLKSTNDPRIKFMLRENDFGTNYSGYVNVQQNGNAAAKAALLQPENMVRYWGKHVFPASVSSAYGFTGGTSSKTFTIGSTGTQNLGLLSAIQSRLFVKNGGFGGFDARSSQNLMHSDEIYATDQGTIKMRTPYLNYAETCFMMAEIAEKGGNGLGKSASQWFYAGVQASFDQYKAAAIAINVPNASNVVIGNFATTLPYKGLPSIYSQAWVNFLTEPDEAWAMWKRTGYPQFTDVRAGNNGAIGDGSTIAYFESLWDGSQNLLIPRRNSLDLSSGSNQNSANYSSAIQNMIAKDPAYGTTALDTKGRIWWDMK